MNQSKKHIVMTLLAEFYVAYDLLTSPLSSEINQMLKILHFRKKNRKSPISAVSRRKDKSALIELALIKISNIRHEIRGKLPKNPLF